MVEGNLLNGAERTGTWVVPWPTASSIGGLLEFRNAEEWVAFLHQHDTHAAVPQHIVAAKCQREQRLYALTLVLVPTDVTFVMVPGVSTSQVPTGLPCP